MAKTGKPRITGQYPKARTKLVGGVQNSTDPADDMIGDWGLADSTGGSSEATMDLDGSFHGERKRGPNG